MHRLLGYIEENVGDLVGDLLPALNEVDGIFRECDPDLLSTCVHQALWHFAVYAQARDPQQLDAAYRCLAGVWTPDRFLVSALVRIFFGFEDLVAIRAQGLYHDDPDAFVDALRVLRAAVREALCVFSDRVQGRYAAFAIDPSGGAGAAGPGETTDRQPAMTAPVHGTPGALRVRRGSGTLPPMATAGFEATPDTQPPTELEARLPLRPSSGPARSALDRLAAARFVGRQAELERLWERLRGVSPASAHEVIGVKAPEGYGKTRLLQRFHALAQERLGVAPVALRARAPRLFSLPLWPFVSMLRGYFGAPLGDPALTEKVRSGLADLAGYLPDDPARQALFDAGLLLLDLLGDEEAGRIVAHLDGRTAGIRLHRSLVLVVEAIAARALVETNAPLVVEIEDAGEMDGPSWELLNHLLVHVRPRARLLVLLTYGGRFFVPAELARYPGFGEIILQQLDMNDAEALIDALLEPNALQDTTRFRLITGARGSPLLLYEATRQLVEDGVIGLDGETWREVAALPAEGVIRDLGGVVARRMARLGPACREVLEIIAVVEDAVGGPVLEEVAARRALGRPELEVALLELQRAGLVHLDPPGPEGGYSARVRHPLVHDEIYRQMTLERRRAVHEDAGEVYARLAGTSAFPSLAADHLAQAGLAARALHGLLDGVDRCTRVHNLVGALELCNQALGLLKGLAREDHDRFLLQVLLRRERVYGLLGHRDNQGNDLRQLEPLAAKVATRTERASLLQRRARHAVLTGRHADAEALLVPALGGGVRGSAGWARAGFVLAVNACQVGQRGDAIGLLDDVQAAGTSALPPRQRGRLAHLRGVLEAREGRLPEALRWLFEAWRAYHATGDLYGEALAVLHLGQHFWTRGRLMDADRLLRRAERLLRRSGEARALSRVLLERGRLHAWMGDLDEAGRCFADVLQLGDKEAHRLDHAAATIALGRVLVARGRYDEATAQVAQCLKDLGRRAMRHPVYVEALNTLALTFATAARGERLIVGALSYAGEAADKATEIGDLRGLVQALGTQVRTLLALGRAAEAESRLGELDAAFTSAVAAEPRLERLRAEVELYRFGVCRARGDRAGAERARQRAWSELMAQVRCLEGTGLEQAFLRNVPAHREIVAAMERDDASTVGA